jgi:hypothetical protein
MPRPHSKTPHYGRYKGFAFISACLRITKKYKDEIKEKDEKNRTVGENPRQNSYDIFICAYKSTPFVQIKILKN